MKINKLNYENYVIDYIEGTLSIELKKDFDLFLEKNENIYEEIKDYISAPILEESNEIFTDKNSLKKAENYRPYIFLALIPFLLIGTYFLLQSKSEKEEIKVEPQEMMQHFAQEKTEAPTKKIKKETKEIIEEKIVEPVKKEVKKNTQKPVKKQTEVKKSNVFFASNEEPKTIETNNIKSVVKEQETTIDIKAIEVMSAVASLETIPLKSFDQEIQFKMIDGQTASTEPKSKTLLDQLGEKRNWMELVTPAAFEDLNLKESIAIESNANVNTSRKILNAFIPESLVK